MKSSINPRGAIVPKIVGYCLAEEKKAVLMEISRQLNINMSLLGTESAGRLVGSVTGIAGVQNINIKVENPSECEMLIMSSLKNSVMDKLLKMLRDNDILIELKCIVTSSNQNWTLSKLAEELQAEHKRFEK